MMKQETVPQSEEARQMGSHGRKMIAPLIITALVVAYYVLFFALLVRYLPGWWRYLLGLGPLVLAGVMVAICRERIREIKGGEEDDLGQY